jgi:hypothetical protein
MEALLTIPVWLLCAVIFTLRVADVTLDSRRNDCAVGGKMSPSDVEGETKVRGIVVPTAWDRFGSPLRVAILTRDEGEYPVSPRGLGRRLFRCLREEISARVVVEQDPDGGEVARVVSFTLVRRSSRDDDATGDATVVGPPPPRRRPGVSKARRDG